MNIAVFGAGCFWCVEAIFSQLTGVESVISGYCNGTTENPTYESVCSGKTGHAEVCRISYDSNIISFEELLAVLFQVHDPTTLNKQGADTGTQYRSAVFYINEAQKKIAEKFNGPVGIVMPSRQYVLIAELNDQESLHQMALIAYNEFPNLPYNISPFAYKYDSGKLEKIKF